MQPKTKAAPDVNRTAASKTTSDSRNLNSNDPLVGWYSLAGSVKPSRERTPKKSWIRKCK